jgi:hypothetical protein
MGLTKSSTFLYTGIAAVIIGIGGFLYSSLQNENTISNKSLINSDKNEASLLKAITTANTNFNELLNTKGGSRRIKRKAKKSKKKKVKQ